MSHITSESLNKINENKIFIMEQKYCIINNKKYAGIIRDYPKKEIYC